MTKCAGIKPGLTPAPAIRDRFSHGPPFDDLKVKTGLGGGKSKTSPVMLRSVPIRRLRPLLPPTGSQIRPTGPFLIAEHSSPALTMVCPLKPAFRKPHPLQSGARYKFQKTGLLRQAEKGGTPDAAPPGYHSANLLEL